MYIYTYRHDTGKRMQNKFHGYSYKTLSLIVLRQCYASERIDGGERVEGQGKVAWMSRKSISPPSGRQSRGKPHI